MGNDLVSIPIEDISHMKKYFFFSPGQVKMIKNRFDVVSSEDMLVTKQQFAKVMKIDLYANDTKQDNDQDQDNPFNKSKSEVDKIYEYFDADNTGKLDYYEWLCILILFSINSLRGKTQMVFDLYDYDKSKIINNDEIVSLLKCVANALNYIAGKPEITIQEAEQLKKVLLDKYDVDSDGQISLKEFQSFISKEQEILKILFNFAIITRDDLDLNFGMKNDIAEWDSDLENEANRVDFLEDEESKKRKQQIKSGIEEKKEDTKSDHQQSQQQSLQNNKSQIKEEHKEKEKEPWIKSLKHLQPTEYKGFKSESNPPALELEIDYVYGYRCSDCRNNLKVSQACKIVYHSTAMGIVLNNKTNQQKQYTEHNDDVLCIDLYQNLAVTGQIGNQPYLCVWDTETLNTTLVVNRIFKNGIQNVQFSSDGAKIAVIDSDKLFTLTVLDYQKAVDIYQHSAANFSKQFNVGVICAVTLSSDPVFFIKFYQNDQFVIVANFKELIFINIEKQTKLYGVWGNYQQQAILVIGTFNYESLVVTGGYNGMLHLWRNNTITTQQKAHNGPITAIYQSNSGQEVVTAGRDLQIVVWDSFLKIRLKISLKDFNIKKLNIISLYEGTIKVGENVQTFWVFGSRDGKIIKLQNNQISTLINGHYYGELWGLAVHPFENIFFTVGQDNLLACWDLTNKTLKNSRILDYQSQVIAISGDGKILSIGCKNGAVIMLNAQSQQYELLYYFLYVSDSATCIKYSNNSEFLAVAHDAPSCVICIYSVKNQYKLDLKCQGSNYKVTHMDFSHDGQFLQVNNAGFEILFFDLTSGRIVTRIETVKDVKWTTFQCIFGWHVFGIWPPSSSGLDINSVDRSNNKQLIASGDDFANIKVFKYPACKQNALFVKYSAHSEQVTNVRFSFDDSYLITTGGRDLTIIQWKVNQNIKIQYKYDDINQQLSDEHAQNLAQEDEDQAEFVLGSERQYVDQIQLQKQLNFKPIFNDEVKGNLILCGAIGYKNQIYKEDTKNLCKSLKQGGRIVYPTAQICIISDSKNQTYFQQHTQEISAMAYHVKNQIIATGTQILQKKNEKVEIYIWDIQTKNVLAYLNDFHTRAISQLDFNTEGNLLLSGGMEDDNCIAIHDWVTQRLIATGKVDKERITELLWKPFTSDFMTVGLRHIKFWSLKGKNLQSKNLELKKKFEPQTALVWSHPGQSNGFFISGTNEGNLYIWDKKDYASGPIIGHTGKVTSLVASKDGFILSAGQDGKIIQWGFQQDNLIQIAIQVDLVREGIQKNFCIISLDLMNENNDMLVVLKNSEIYEQKFNQMTWKPSISFNKSHFQGKLSALCFSPHSSIFATSGGDKKIRIWDSQNNKQLYETEELEFEIKTMDWSENEKFIAAADIKNNIYIFEQDQQFHLLDVDKKISGLANLIPSNRKNEYYSSSCIKIAPNCLQLAIGAQGGPSPIEIWNINQNRLIKSYIIKIGLASGVTFIDWSEDCTVIAINSQSQELKFVNTEQKKEVSAKECSYLPWHCVTLPYFWQTSGLIKNTLDGSKAYSLCQTKNKKMILASTHIGELQLYNYPVVHQNQLFKQNKGHSGKVANIRWSLNDKYVVSIGLDDRTILVWENILSNQYFEQNQTQMQIQFQQTPAKQSVIQQQMHSNQNDRISQISGSSNKMGILSKPQPRGSRFLVLDDQNKTNTPKNNINNNQKGIRKSREHFDFSQIQQLPQQQALTDLNITDGQKKLPRQMSRQNSISSMQSSISKGNKQFNALKSRKKSQQLQQFLLLKNSEGGSQDNEATLYRKEQDMKNIIQFIQFAQPLKRKYGIQKYGKILKKEMANQEFQDDHIETNNNDDQQDDESKDNNSSIVGGNVFKKGKNPKIVFTNQLYWKSLIQSPSWYYKDPVNHLEKPKISVHLEHVFGYRTHGCHNNIKFLKNGNIVHFASSLGIVTVINQQIPTQKYFQRHKNTITAIDLNPDGLRIATAESGDEAVIYIWDAQSMYVQCEIQLPTEVQVVQYITFNTNGQKLAVLSSDNYHKLLVYDISINSEDGKLLLCQNYIGIGFIKQLLWRNDVEFASCGIEHLCIWTIFQNSSLKQKSIRLNTQEQVSSYFLCCETNGEEYICGAYDGSIQIFKQGNLLSVKSDAHGQRPVDCLYYNQMYLFSGGRDSRVNIWDRNINYLFKIDLFQQDERDLKQFNLIKHNSEIKSICLSPDLKTMIIGTSASEIFELTTKDSKLTNSTKFVFTRPLMQAVSSPNQVKNELWGLETFQNDPDKFLVGGDDAFIRMYSISQKALIKQQITNHQIQSTKENDQEDIKLIEIDSGDLQTKDILPQFKVRAISVSSDGENVVVGFRDGTVRSYDRDLNLKRSQLVCKDGVSDIKFSPNGDTVSIGSMDNAIYLYKYPDLGSKCKPMRKHLVPIKKIDFSVDGNLIQSCCTDNQLIYWQTSNGQTISDRNMITQLIRNEKWSTMNNPLKWQTQGIWPEKIDQYDLCCERSNHTLSKKEHPPDNYFLLASYGDSSEIKIYRYPCNNHHQKFISLKGHMSFIPRVRFSSNDQHLISIGGEDNCIYVWRISQN